MRFLIMFGLVIGAEVCAAHSAAAQQHFALGASVVDELHASSAMLMVGAPLRSLAEPANRGSFSPTFGVGVASDVLRQGDLPFIDVGLSVSRALAQWNVIGQRVALAAHVAGSMEYAAPFESVVVGGTTIDFGRNGLWIPAARAELLSLISLGGPRSPAILTYSVGRIERFSSRADNHGLGDRWYMRFGMEIATR